jgi:hypothetical protein
MLYVAFERGNLPRFQTEFGVLGSTTACTVLSYGGCFYPKVEGERVAVWTEKGAIRPNGARGAGRIDTLRILPLWNYGIAVAAFLRGA